MRRSRYARIPLAYPRLGEANQRYQNMVQTKRQQQALAGAENHRSKVAGAIDDMTQSTNSHRKNRPDERDNQADKPHHNGGNDRYKTRTAEKSQRIRQTNGMKPFMQHPDNNTSDNGAEDAGIDRGDAQNILAAESITALLRYNPTISAVVCYNETIAMGAWFGLLRAGRQSGESGVDRYFEQQVSLAAFADVAENALDDLPIIWASTPAREIGYTLAERILQRIAHDEHHVRSQTIAARLVTQK